MKSIFLTFRIKENFGDGHNFTPFIMHEFYPFSKWRKWRKSGKYSLDFHKEQTMNVCKLCNEAKGHTIPYNGYHLKLGYLLGEMYR